MIRNPFGRGAHRSSRREHSAASRRARLLLTVLGAALGLGILTAGVAFGFWISSDDSNPAEAVAASLSVPTSPNAMADGGEAVTVSWTLPGTQLPGVQYEVVSTHGVMPNLDPTSMGYPNFTQVCTVSAPTDSCIDTGLDPDTFYEYWIVAILDDWQSPFIHAAVTTPTPTFSITLSPGPYTAGTPITVESITAEVDDSPDPTYTGVKTIDWSGLLPSPSPSSTPPSYPSGSVSFTDGVADPSSTFTAYDAGSDTLTATDGTYSVITGSANLTLDASTQTTIAISSGDNQSATVNTAFASPLVALVTDSYANPVPGVDVTFTGPSSSPSETFASCSSNPQLYSCVATTDGSGLATSSTFAADGTEGSYDISASASGTGTVSFSETNNPDPNIALTSGGGQSATVDHSFSSPLIAKVTDGSGNPVSGVTVTFSAPSSGASAIFAGGVTTAVTGSDGEATSAGLSANTTAGGYAVTASASGTGTVSFSETNTAGAASSIAASSGSGQSAAITTGFTDPLIALVTDRYGNAVSGATVSFSAPSSGASASFAGGVTTATTSSNGKATSAGLSANSTSGSYRISASASGTSTVNFSETNSVNTIAISSGSGQSAVVGTAFANPLVATVTDSHGNPVSGATVSFSAPSSGASATFAGGVTTAVTGSNGEATSTGLTANTSAGNYQISASASSTGAVSFSETNKPGAASSIIATSGSGQSATVNTGFASPLVATVNDEYGNPVPGVTVSFSAPGSGASTSFAGGVTTATTGSNGEATSASLTANTVSGSYQISASAVGTGGVNFAEANRAGAPHSITVSSGSGQSATVNTAFASPLVATVTDSFGNPVSGVTVTFTAPTSGASASFATNANTATTGSSGKATSAGLSANTTSGTYNISAGASGTDTVTFSETNNPGSAHSVAVSTGSGQSATVHTAFASPLIALVTDSFGNPVQGVSVSFTAPTSGPSASFAGGTTTATTGSNGMATSAGMSANTTAGSYTISAAAPGAGSVNFSETNNPGAAVGIVLSNVTTAPAPGLTESGSVGSQSYASTGEAASSGNVLVAKVALADQYGNLVNATSALTIDLSTSGSGTLAPTGTGALTINSGTSTSTASFTLTRATGTGESVILTATLHGSSETFTVTLSS